MSAPQSLQSAPQTIWITGAGSGIGRALALSLANLGHTVIISGRDAGKLKALAAQVDAGQVLCLPCDVADDKAMAGILNSLQPAITHLDMVIACAGICEYVDLPDLDVDMVRRVCDTNFIGVVNTCAAALPWLREAARVKPGCRPHIVGVGSMSSYIAFPRAEAYGAAKAAMSYFLDCLRIDLGADMDVTVVYPGFVETPMTARNDFPMPDLVTVDQAAAHILRRLPRRPRQIAFPWRLNLVLKLAALVPGLWYGKVAPGLRRTPRQETGS